MSSSSYDAIEREVLKARQHGASVDANRSLTPSESSDDAVEHLRDLLLEPRLFQMRQQGQALERQLNDIEHQIADPDRHNEWVRSVLTSALSSEARYSAEALAQAIAPIVAEALSERIGQSPEELGRAIAPEMATALREQVRLEPDAIANAIAPEMGKAIKDQIVMERDAMVDALYPVIGSTIAKYLAATLENINRKLEEALSVEGVKRKIRARLQGISEAELLLRESVPFFVQNVFLIHKNSGLVIAEAQQAEGPMLESDMIAGMLTAIRSFVNEYIAQSGDMSELDDIKYGNSEVMLEVAGYCYLAVVVQGQPPQAFARDVSRTLSHIIQTYGDAIEAFTGDLDEVPSDVKASLDQLCDRYTPALNEPESVPIQRGRSALTIGVTALAIVLLLWGTGSWLSHRLEMAAERALFSNPELSVYRLEADAQRGLFHPHGTLTLTGRVPDAYLQQKAASVASTVVSARARIANEILAVETPTNPVLTAAEVERVTAVLNRQDSVDISTTLDAGRVTARGTVEKVADADAIAATLAAIPGVRSVTNVTMLTPLTLPTRIYFKANSAQIPATLLNSKLEPVRAFLEQYPDTRLRIIGHSDTSGVPQTNQLLALRRAQTVKYALELIGIEPTRLEVVGIGEPPRGVDTSQPNWLSRCVRFEPLRPLRAPQLH
ncbi:MAG: OmpA family protein [Cyanobacteria bacterium P01_D01_bin.123]